MKHCMWICLFSLFLTCMSADCRLTGQPFVPETLFLKGAPYDLGFQHGERLKDAVRYNIERYVDCKILANQDHPQIKSFLSVLPEVVACIPQDYLEELKGLAEGADVPYEKVLLFNLFPEMFHCSGLTVKGKATKGGELLHVRVLDYAAGADLQDTAVLIIVAPEGKIPFMNVSYAGFIGTVTGMNLQKIALGEIGGAGYGHYIGMPMAFLLREVLEQANKLEEVKKILTSTPRTCEYYYLFSDGKNEESVGVYATKDELQFIEPGGPYALFDSGNTPENQAKASSFNKIVVHSNQIEMSPHQTLIYRDEEKKRLWGLIHQQPQDCLVLTGFCYGASYTRRYPILVDRILERYGKIGVADLQEIVKGEAGLASNLHTAIFSPSTLEAWVAHAGLKGEPAWSQPYSHFKLDSLLQKMSSSYGEGEESLAFSAGTNR